jgi:hypothetical protein
MPAIADPSLIHILFCDTLRYLSSTPYLLRNIPNILAIPSTVLSIVNVTRLPILRFRKWSIPLNLFILQPNLFGYWITLTLPL